MICDYVAMIGGEITPENRMKLRDALGTLVKQKKLMKVGNFIFSLKKTNDAEPNSARWKLETNYEQSLKRKQLESDKANKSLSKKQKTDVTDIGKFAKIFQRFIS